MTIQDYGYTGAIPTDDNSIPARITAVFGNQFAFICEQGSGLARLKTKEYDCGAEEYPTTGDFVLLRYQADGESLIIRTMPRRTSFQRLDPSSSGRSAQTVAANFDTVFLMQSLNQNFNLHRMERYLTLAWQSGAMPVIVLTKSDLSSDAESKIHEAASIAPGVPVLTVSVRTGDGLDKVKQWLKPKTTAVFLGSSGVGKSSLVNALAGEEVMTVSEIRQSDARGRHTTTRRQLIFLPSGAMIIDTPGMRELGMWDVREGLEKSFADVEQFLGRCRFHDCSHTNEPGCAVQEAIASGALDEERWTQYCRLKTEAKYSEDKGDFLRQKQRRNKEIAKKARRLKKNGEIQR